MNEFKKGYQPRSNFVKDDIGDLLADSHNSLKSWKNYFSQLLNIRTWGQRKSRYSDGLWAGQPTFDSWQCKLFFYSTASSVRDLQPGPCSQPVIVNSLYKPLTRLLVSAYI
jgi:hypothetical protein